MILSGYASSSNENIECFKADKHGISTLVPELANIIEEADVGLLPQIQLSSWYKIVASYLSFSPNDTMILLVYSLPDFTKLCGSKIHVLNDALEKEQYTLTHLI